MSAQIFYFEQGTPEWDDARLGLATASCFDQVVTGGKTRQTYMRKLAAEIITREAQTFETADTSRGHDHEPKAIGLYEFKTGLTVQKVGFVRSGNKGASPDGLVGSMGAVEAKSKAPHLQIEVLENDVVPAEHIAQCQGVLWTCEREWIDFISYWPRLPLFVKRLYRDEKYITKLSNEVDQFNDELAALVERIRRYELAA